MERQMYTIPETAYLIGMKSTKTRELIRDKKIFSVRIGRSVRVPANAIEEFIGQLEKDSVVDAEKGLKHG